jgi:hypothetical protein
MLICFTYLPLTGNSEFCEYLFPVATKEEEIQLSIVKNEKLTEFIGN